MFFQNHAESSKRGKTKSNREKRLKIQIGSGNHPLEGFLNSDIMPPADAIYDVREGLPVKTGSVDFIFSEHLLEHIDYPHSVKKVIGECYRVLKKGGEAVISVPDGELIIDAYYQKDKKFYKKFFSTWYKKRNCTTHFNTYIDLINYHFRDQDDDVKYNPHFWSYDKEKLFSLLKEAGFRTVGKWKFDEKIANPERKFGSIYVYGRK